MNKITLLSASAFCMVVCSTCSTPDQTLILEAQAFADMQKNGSAGPSSGVKCSSIKDQGVVTDSLQTANYSGIICTED